MSSVVDTIKLFGGVHSLLASVLHSTPRGWCTAGELLQQTNVHTIDLHHALAELIDKGLLVKTNGMLSLSAVVPPAVHECVARARLSVIE
jgi:predicted transcriptional regulator